MKRRTPEDWFATWLRRLRWPAVVFRLLLSVLLHSFGGKLSDATNDSAAAYLPSAAQSTKVADIQEGTARVTPATEETDPAVVVLSSASGLTRSDAVDVTAARTAVAKLAGHVAPRGNPSSVVGMHIIDAHYPEGDWTR